MTSFTSWAMADAALCERFAPKQINRDEDRKMEPVPQWCPRHCTSQSMIGFATWKQKRIWIFSTAHDKLKERHDKTVYTSLGSGEKHAKSSLEFLLLFIGETSGKWFVHIISTWNKTNISSLLCWALSAYQEQQLWVVIKSGSASMERGRTLICTTSWLLKDKLERL